MSYATLTELKAAVEIAASDTADDTDLQRALDAATQWIDQHTGRTFTLSGSTTKTYLATDADVLRVVDLVTASSVTVDSSGNQTYGTTLDTTNYYLWPLNDGRYQEIRVLPTSSTSFSPGHFARVTGTFGYLEGSPGATPPSVKQACLLLATRWFKRHEKPFALLEGSGEFGPAFGRIPGHDPDVELLLAPYRLTGGRTWLMV